MPKLLSLGNGNILVMLDKFARVCDFFFPYVGLENQIGRFKHRIGAYTDGKLHWFDEPAWDVTIDSGHETLSGHIQAVNKEQNLSIHLHEIVYNEKNIYIRKISVENGADYKRDVKMFFSHQFELYESHRGDTAYYDPIHKTLIHYKGRRVLLINALSQGNGFDDYAVGLFGIEGKEGTHLDAEDGVLSKNAIEHGQVDSVMGVTLTLQPHERKVFYYWITVAESLEEAHDLNNYVITKTPEHLIRTTQDYWYAWVNKENFGFYGLPEKITELFKKSLFTIRSHVDNDGAVLASGDSDLLQHGRDYYSYVWPRDGAYTVMALDKAGYGSLARKFFEFCNEIITDDGYLMHKYRPDKSLGSSWHPWMRHGNITYPIQEDETALVLIALWNHYILTRDIEFIEKIYNSFIKKAADFLVRYTDPETGLPLPSYDLWEENYGVFTYTAGSVYAALMCAARFANILGKSDTERKYNMVADNMHKAIMKHLYDSERGVFYKMIKYNKNVLVSDPTLDISSAFAAYYFGLMDLSDERLNTVIDKTVEALTCNTNIGGIARYQNDYYFRAAQEVTGNPWIITTLWMARYKMLKAKNLQELNETVKTLEWVASHALSSGILPEQLHPYTGEPISATPLVWSHSEFVSTVMTYMEKLEQLGVSAVSQGL